MTSVGISYRKPFLQKGGMIIMNTYFDKQIDNWLNNHIRVKVKPSTYDGYDYRVSKYLAPYFKEMKIEEITSNDIQIFISTLKNEKTNEKLSANTIQGIFRTMAYFYDYCVESNKVDKNPCMKVFLPKSKVKKITTFTKIEKQIIIETVKKQAKPRSYLVLTALLTGMRLGELCSLRWENVDMRNGLIHVQTTNRRIYTEDNKTKVVTTSPKTDYSRRIIPISKHLLEVLKGLKKANSEYVFYKSNGNGYDNRGIQKYFRLLLKDLGISGKSFHTLRHTFATTAIEARMDVKTLSMMLGHSSVTTTMNLYVHPNETHTRKAMEDLSSYMLN